MQVPKPNFKRRSPKRGQRGAITKEQYQLALEWFGDTCNHCNATPIEMHHVVYRSQSGRGGYRNLMPLCKKHHAMAHSSREFSDHLKEERIEAFGEYFFTDEHDLFNADLIDEATPAKFENYMNEMGKNR